MHHDVGQPCGYVSPPFPIHTKVLCTPPFWYPAYLRRIITDIRGDPADIALINTAPVPFTSDTENASEFQGLHLHLCHSRSPLFRVTSRPLGEAITHSLNEIFPIYTNLPHRSHPNELNKRVLMEKSIDMARDHNLCTRLGSNDAGSASSCKACVIKVGDTVRFWLEVNIISIPLTKCLRKYLWFQTHSIIIYMI